MRRPTPAVTLLFLAPFVGEVLLGSTLLSRLPLFLVQVGMYGGGALLIRELVRRRNLVSHWLLLLGFAYGVFEEGIVLQSLFNPHFPGLDILGTYGRAAGVNWVWAEFILGYHAVFSISIPVVLTELMFPEESRTTWLSRRALILVAAGFLANCLLLAVFLTGAFSRRHTPTPPALLLAAAAVAGTVVA
ncbi:MAG TPA: hypothetical protein VGP74_06315, partial [Rubrobacteraceae bacterium]|nr:hypothetical protein [Rubrobacteraceae bacterium]